MRVLGAKQLFVPPTKQDRTAGDSLKTLYESNETITIFCMSAICLRPSSSTVCHGGDSLDSGPGTLTRRAPWFVVIFVVFRRIITVLITVVTSNNLREIETKIMKTRHTVWHGLSQKGNRLYPSHYQRVLVVFLWPSLLRVSLNSLLFLYTLHSTR